MKESRKPDLKYGWERQALSSLHLPASPSSYSHTLHTQNTNVQSVGSRSTSFIIQAGSLSIIFCYTTEAAIKNMDIKSHRERTPTSSVSQLKLTVWKNNEMQHNLVVESLHRWWDMGLELDSELFPFQLPCVYTGVYHGAIKTMTTMCLLAQRQVQSDTPEIGAIINLLQFILFIVICSLPFWEMNSR